MKTTTTPEGRRAGNEGYPLRVCELLAALDAPYYLERVAIGDAKHNHRARKPIRTAIENQLHERGFSLVEILSPCPTGWKMTPPEAARLALDEMTKTFPLGVVRAGHGLDLGHPRRRAEVALAELPALLDLDRGAEAAFGGEEPRIEETRIKIAGFGGQAVLVLGTLVAHAGMLARRRVSWLPSYGPEMRGGTANCAVTLSDVEIGSPLIQNPTHLVALNGPSLERFEADVVPGGTILFNASMIEAGPHRTDVTAVPVPASAIAERLGDVRVANMVMLGALLARGCAVSMAAVLAALPEVVEAEDELLDLDRRALEAGRGDVCAGYGDT
jgi:2-oxoisovalerate ferredoxin oxidoreductase beta subunit